MFLVQLKSWLRTQVILKTNSAAEHTLILYTSDSKTAVTVRIHSFIQEKGCAVTLTSDFFEKNYNKTSQKYIPRSSLQVNSNHSTSKWQDAVAVASIRCKKTTKAIKEMLVWSKSFEDAFKNSYLRSHTLSIQKSV